MYHDFFVCLGLFILFLVLYLAVFAFSEANKYHLFTIDDSADSDKNFLFDLILNGLLKLFECSVFLSLSFCMFSFIICHRYSNNKIYSFSGTVVSDNQNHTIIQTDDNLYYVVYGDAPLYPLQKNVSDLDSVAVGDTVYVEYSSDKEDYSINCITFKITDSLLNL